MFEKLLARLAQKQVEKAINKTEYSAGTSIQKGVPTALLAILVPIIINMASKNGFTISDADAMQIILWILAGGAVLRNWFKNYILPKFVKNPK